MVVGLDGFEQYCLVGYIYHLDILSYVLLLRFASLSFKTKFRNGRIKDGNQICIATRYIATTENCIGQCCMPVSGYTFDSTQDATDWSVRKEHHVKS